MAAGECKFISPAAENYSRLPLELAGICPVAFGSEPSRALFGNLMWGCLSYRDKPYCFSSREAAAAFAAEPAKLVSLKNEYTKSEEEERNTRRCGA